MKWFVRLFLVGCLLAGTVGGASAQEQVTLHAATWDTAEGAHWIRVAFDKFEAQHPNIKIELESIAQGYSDQIITRIAGGNPPDTFMWWNLPNIVVLGGIEPLDQYDIDFSGIEPILINWNSYKDHIYGVPKDFTTRVIWYNEELFDRYGVPYPTEDWTWEEFRQTAIQLTHPEDGVYGFIVSPSSYSWEAWAAMMGGDFIDPGGVTMCGYLNGQATIEAIRFLTDLYLVDQVSPAPEMVTAMGGSYELFSSGKVAMIDSGMWFLGYLRAKGIDPYQTRFKTVLWPHPEGRPLVCMLHTCGWVLASASQHKPETLEVLQFLAEERGETQGQAGWAFPTSIEVAREVGLLDNPVTRPFFTALQYVLENPHFLRTELWWEKFDKYISDAFDMIMLREKTVEEALNWAVDESEKALGRR